MFVHLDPVSGSVEPYTDEVQQILSNRPIPSQTFLGNICFNATIYLTDDGEHYQTTPAIPQGRKQPGYREIRRVTDVSHFELFKVKTQQGWRFCNDTTIDINKKSVTLKPIHNRAATWQWCTKSFISLHEEDWMCYESFVNQDLEKQWTMHENVSFQLTFPIGITNKQIFVDRRSAFFFQEDTKSKKHRWVRRILMDQTDLQHLRTKSLKHCPDGLCSICICNYSETTMMPRKTLSCSHTFHCACLAHVINKMCPLCRTPFI